MTGPVLAVDIGGSKIAAAVVEGDHVVAAPLTVPTPAQQGGEAIVAAVLAVSRDVLAARTGEPVVAAGVASAGTVDPVSGRIIASTDLLRDWASTPLRDLVAQDLCLPVSVLNDVHAHGVGEAVAGAARGFGSALVIAVGTGVGGCLVVGGRPELGAHGVAGHVGHISVAEASGLLCTCGRIGHLEAVASGSGVQAAFARRTGQDLTTAQVAALAGSLEDDEGPVLEAREVLTAAGRATGRVIGGLLNVLDPEVVVVGGGMAAAGPLWSSALEEGVAAEVMDVVAGTPLRLSTAGPRAALIGAAHHALAALHAPEVSHAH